MNASLLLPVVIALWSGSAAVDADHAPARAADGRQTVQLAAIAGIVIDSGDAPLKRARVSLVAVESNNTTSLSAVTDGDGRFAFTGLLAGRYRLSASKPGYLGVTYGARRAGGPGTSLFVAGGQQVTNVVLKLAHGSVITGTIFDPTGEPAAGMQVRLLQFEPGPEGAVLVPVTGQTSTGMTDDHGVYRCYGLSSGDYVVSALPIARIATAGPVQLITQADLDRALRDVHSAATAGSATPDERAVEGGTSVGYSPVFYPGTTSPGQATPIRLGVGEERTGIDFSLELVHTARIDGNISNAAGPLTGPVHVLLVQQVSRMPGLGVVSRTVAAPPEWKFSFASVTPGQYTIAASAERNMPNVAGTRGLPTASPQSAEPREGPSQSGWVLSNITVGDQDLTGLALTLQPGTTVNGRITFDRDPTDPPPQPRLTLNPVQDAGQVIFGSVRTLTTSVEGLATAVVPPGRYSVTATGPTASPNRGPSGWTVKAVVVNGRDVTDVGVELRSSETVDMAVTVTDRVTEMSGVLRDASGRATSDYSVMVFPADRSLWTWQSRRIVSVRPTTEGRFLFRGLPPGEYFLTAVFDLEPNEQFDSKILDELVRASIRMTLAEGERRTQDIRLAGGEK
jgi:hypothetical protein